VFKFFELFDLTLNTINIETPSVGIATVETTGVQTFNLLL